MRDEDGFYYIVDRKKDMYISGGENVYPAQVEAAIAELTQVADCAVVGVPDQRWGEVGRVYVVPVAGQLVTAEDILTHCMQRLAKYKVPKSVVITDSLPRTASGKVQKHVLRETRARGIIAGLSTPGSASARKKRAGHVVSTRATGGATRPLQWPPPNAVYEQEARLQALGKVASMVLPFGS